MVDFRLSLFRTCMTGRSTNLSHQSAMHPCHLVASSDTSWVNSPIAWCPVGECVDVIGVEPWVAVAHQWTCSRLPAGSSVSIHPSFPASVVSVVVCSMHVDSFAHCARFLPPSLLRRLRHHVAIVAGCDVEAVMIFGSFLVRRTSQGVVPFGANAS